MRYKSPTSDDEEYRIYDVKTIKRSKNSPDRKK